MKRRIFIIMAVVLLMTAFLIGCSDKSQSEDTQNTVTSETTIDRASQKPEATPVPPQSSITVGLVYAGDGYEAQLNKNQFMSLMAISSIQITTLEQEADVNNPSIAIEDLILQGCEVIFTYGVNENIVLQMAEKNPEVNFEIYNGQDTNSLENVSSYYIRLYQQQYLNGMLAGYLSISENVAYIAQKADNDDVRRLNAFALGVKEANNNAIVHFVWSGENDTDEAFNSQLDKLSDKNCDVFMKLQADKETIQYAIDNDIALISSGNIEYEKSIRMIEPFIMDYMLVKLRSILDNSYDSNDIYDGWIGINSYEIDATNYPLIMKDDLVRIQNAMSRMAKGDWDVFTGPIVDSYGQVIIPEGVKISDEDLFYMLWYVENIEAMPPPMG